MVETPYPQILIVPASPETKNRNAGLCGVVERAFRQKLGDASVSVAPLEDAALRVRQLGRGFVLLFGSALPDECEFERVTAVARERGLPVAFWTTEDPYELDAAYKFIDAVDVIFTNGRWTERH